MRVSNEEAVVDSQASGSVPVPPDTQPEVRPDSDLLLEFTTL